jgi:hypothetical protein
MLIYQYKYREDKLTVIFALAVVGTWNIDEKTGKSKYGIDYEEIYKWIAEAWNEMMRELVEDHDYSRMHGLYFLKGVIKKTYAIRSMDIDTAGFDRRIANALTFRVEWEYKDALGTAYIYHLSGEAEVSMNQTGEQNGRFGYFGDGAGVGRGDGAELNKSDELTGINPPSFNNNARLSNLDPCREKSITVGIDDFGEKVEFTLFDKDFADWPGGGISVKSIQQVKLLQDKLVEGFYTFEFPLINLQEKCVDDKYEVNFYDGSFVSEVTIRLFHAPKPDVYIVFNR